MLPLIMVVQSLGSLFTLSYDLFVGRCCRPGKVSRLQKATKKVNAKSIYNTNWNEMQETPLSILDWENSER